MNYLTTDDGKKLLPPGELEPMLKGAFPAFIHLIGYIRFNYVMDEIWTPGTNTGKLSAYQNELKFRRGGKTLVTLYARDGFFKVVLILGKDERVKFEERKSEFSDAIRKIYDDTHTYHDGKWLGIDVFDNTLIDDIIRLLRMKRKPNRKPASFSLDEATPCGVRCDLCLINVQNNQNGYAGSELFHEMDWRCYHDDREERIDQKKTVCQGCDSRKNECPTHLCLAEKGISSCLKCGDYHSCGKSGVGVDPGMCNLGISADDVTRCILPYCSKERLDYFKQQEQPSNSKKG